MRASSECRVSMNASTMGKGASRNLERPSTSMAQMKSTGNIRQMRRGKIQEYNNDTDDGEAVLSNMDPSIDDQVNV